MAVLSPSAYLDVTKNYANAIVHVANISDYYLDAAYEIVITSAFDPEIDLDIPFFNSYTAMTGVFDNPPQAVIEGVRKLQEHVLKRGVSSVTGLKYINIDEYYTDNFADPHIHPSFASLSSQAGFEVEATHLTSSPVLLTATYISLSNEIRLDYDIDLTVGLFSTSEWAACVEDKNATIDQVEVAAANRKRIVIGVTPELPFGCGLTETVTYTAASQAIQDAGTVFIVKPLTNEVLTPTTEEPLLITVNFNSNNTKITLIYDQTIKNQAIPTGDFTNFGPISDRTVNSVIDVAVVVQQVVVNLDLSGFGSGFDPADFDYTGSSIVGAITGDAAETFTNEVITQPSELPTLLTASYNVGNKEITLTYNRSIDTSPSITLSQFGDGIFEDQTVSSFDSTVVNSDVITIGVTLDGVFGAGLTGNLDYTRGGGNRIKAAVPFPSGGQDAANLVNRVITQNGEIPNLTNATLDTGLETITLTFDQSLDGVETPPGSNFTNICSNINVWSAAGNGEIDNNTIFWSATNEGGSCSPAEFSYDNSDEGIKSVIGNDHFASSFTNETLTVV